MDQRQVVPPSADELQTYSLGTCQPPRAAEIEAFLTDGPDCSAILAAAPEDALVRHRDLKPANVLPTAAGAPKLSDFGLARRPGDTRGLTATGAIQGTPGYLAPEQADAERKALGPHTDDYGLGAILYYLLTGRPPVQAATFAEIIRRTCEEEPVRPALLRPGVPRDLETVCLKCLQKDPSRRYAAARDLAEDLRRFQAGEPIAARPVGPVERGWRWCRRHPAVALPSAAAGLLLLAVSAASVVFAVAQGRAAVNLQAEKDRAQAALKQSRSNEALLTGDRANRRANPSACRERPPRWRSIPASRGWSP